MFFFLAYNVKAQGVDFDTQLFDGHDKLKEKSISIRRTKHTQIQPLIEQLKNEKGFEVNKLGESIEGRAISLISIGTGDIDVLLWSQMHGDEPTATMAIFDIFNFLIDKKELKKEKREMLKQVKLHFLPMLNPDGAEVYKRRNALGIDMNRDALRLQSPESVILKGVRDSLDAEFGFNLHDQSVYYNVDRTAKPATISYLAPAYDYAKSINEVRSNAMKVIVYMNNIIQRYAPGQVGRYNDDFEPRAFGDNIQKWGTSAILIESGGYTNDPEKQFIRKLNYISILSSVFAISSGDFQNMALEDYEKIPNNDRKLFDLKIEKLTYNLLGKDYILDIGIHRSEIDNEAHNKHHYLGKISNIGDLSTFYGYETVDASGMNYGKGEVYINDIITMDSLRTVDIDQLLLKGFTSIKLDSIPEGISYSPFPINLTLSDENTGEELKIGNSATFVIKEKEVIKYVVINGFLFDIKSANQNIVNGVIR